MQEILNDTFYELAKQYSPNSEFHLVGEVDYHLLRDDRAYEGLKSHKAALVLVFDRLVDESIKDLESVRERLGDDIADQLSPTAYDIDKAKPTPLTPQAFFYEWTTDWSDFFDDGHEWYGACCWSVYDKTMNRYVVMLVSATD